MELKFPTLNKDQVELRVGSTAKDNSGFSLLLYKTARVDDEILDSVVGPFNWQRKHYELKGNIYCSVGIYDENRNTWVWKDDCGKESNTEAEKGESSDSFKRACFQWGIGRELYTAPFIWITGYDSKTRFTVTVLEVNENKEISKLEIIEDKSKKVVFTYPKAKQADAATNTTLSKEIIDEAAKYRVNLQKVAIYYHTTVDQLTDSQVKECIERQKTALEGRKQ